MLNDSQHIGHSSPSSVLAFDEVSSSEKSWQALTSSAMFFSRPKPVMECEIDLHMMKGIKLPTYIRKFDKAILWSTIVYKIHHFSRWKKEAPQSETWVLWWCNSCFDAWTEPKTEKVSYTPYIFCIWVIITNRMQSFKYPNSSNKRIPSITSNRTCFFLVPSQYNYGNKIITWINQLPQAWQKLY